MTEKTIKVKTWHNIENTYISRNTKVNFQCDQCGENSFVAYKYLINRTDRTALFCTKCMHSNQVARRNSMNTKEDGWECIGCKLKFNTRREWQLHTKQCNLRKKATKKRKSINATQLNKKRIKAGEALFRKHLYVYNGIEFDSSWELAFWIYHIENNIEIERNTESFKYVFNNKEYNYYPDFIIDEKLYEIKGDMFLNENFNGYEKWQAKLKQVVIPKGINVLYEKKVKPYLEYITTKYDSTYLKSFKV